MVRVRLRDGPAVDQYESESKVGKTGSGTVQENLDQCTCCSPVMTTCQF